MELIPAKLEGCAKIKYKDGVHVGKHGSVKTAASVLEDILMLGVGGESKYPEFWFNFSHSDEFVVCGGVREEPTGATKYYAVVYAPPERKAVIAIIECAPFMACRPLNLYLVDENGVREDEAAHPILLRILLDLVAAYPNEVANVKREKVSKEELENAWREVERLVMRALRTR